MSKEFYMDILNLSVSILTISKDFHQAQYMCLMLFFIGVLCYVSFTDLRDRTIPNRILGVAIVVRYLYFFQEWILQQKMLFSFMDSAFWMKLCLFCLDGLSVSLPLFLLTLFVEKVRGKASFGGGDIKLLFVTGLYLGWERNLTALFLACVMMLAVMLVKAVRKKDAVDKAVPFAPAIAVGAVCMLFF